MAKDRAGVVVMRDNLRHIADRIRLCKHEVAEESSSMEDPEKMDERRVMIALLEKSFMDHVNDKPKKNSQIVIP